MSSKSGQFGLNNPLNAVLKILDDNNNAITAKVNGHKFVNNGGQYGSYSGTGVNNYEYTTGGVSTRVNMIVKPVGLSTNFLKVFYEPNAGTDGYFSGSLSIQY